VRLPLFEIAPLADFDRTTEWLKTISMGDMESWTADCKRSPAD